MSQEPGTAGEIREFCTKNYGVTFPMMEKISISDQKKCYFGAFLIKNVIFSIHFSKYSFDIHFSKIYIDTFY